MEVDPLASMRCWAIELEIGGRTFTVPALPAVDWWPVLVNVDLSAILDMIESSSEDISDALLAGELDGKALTEALADALVEATGRSLHVSFILAAAVNSQWAAIGGHLAERGFRWDVMPIGAALDAAYAVLMDRLDKDSREKFLAVLNNEALTNGGKPTEKQRAQVTTEFEAMAGPRPTRGAVRATDEPSGSEQPRTPQRSQPRLPAAGSPSPKRPRAPRG